MQRVELRVRRAYRYSCSISCLLRFEKTPIRVATSFDDDIIAARRDSYVHKQTRALSANEFGVHGRGDLKYALSRCSGQRDILQGRPSGLPPLPGMLLLVVVVVVVVVVVLLLLLLLLRARGACDPCVWFYRWTARKVTTEYVFRFAVDPSRSHGAASVCDQNNVGNPPHTGVLLCVWVCECVEYQTTIRLKCKCLLGDFNFK